MGFIGHFPTFCSLYPALNFYDVYDWDDGDVAGYAANGNNAPDAGGGVDAGDGDGDANASDEPLYH